jgi:hypothetical protein
MKRVKSYAKFFYILLIPVVFILFACNEWTIPANLPGIYTGNARAIIRFDNDGQYIYRDKNVMISLNIDSIGHVTGLVGEATFEECNVKQNRGWIARQLNIKTDFLIRGMLKGNIFDKDTITNKDITIPFNIVNGELKGSLVQTTKGESFPMISILKLQKR